MARRTHDITTITAKIGTTEIWQAVAEAREHGATHYRIIQPHPHDPTQTWVAAAGPVMGALSREYGRGDKDDSEWTL